ncbi:MAG: hypothetical protein GOV02_00930 [Candidatus Aenigmarchaeota archaeon]|nr:hypothetical protein [Candidatus Aenigmarchaeota archaeon]
MSVAKKGITIPVVGSLLIVVSIIFLYSITQAVETKQRTIMLKGELAISGQNQAEITKRFGEVAFARIAQSVVRETNQDCSGLTLLNNIRAGLPRGTKELGSFKTLQWLDPEIDINTFTNTEFHITGKQALEFKDSRINMVLRINAMYDEHIQSSYFDGC